MLDFRIFKEEEAIEDEKKEPLICTGCKKVITGDYFYDKITQQIYCSKECYLEQIEKEYFD